MRRNITVHKQFQNVHFARHTCLVHLLPAEIGQLTTLTVMDLWYCAGLASLSAEIGCTPASSAATTSPGIMYHLLNAA